MLVITALGPNDDGRRLERSGSGGSRGAQQSCCGTRRGARSAPGGRSGSGAQSGSEARSGQSGPAARSGLSAPEERSATEGLSATGGRSAPGGQSGSRAQSAPGGQSGGWAGGHGEPHCCCEIPTGAPGAENVPGGRSARPLGRGRPRRRQRALTVPAKTNTFTINTCIFRQ